jgi:hypothetical protein
MSNVDKLLFLAAELSRTIRRELSNVKNYALDLVGKVKKTSADVKAAVRHFTSRVDAS